MSASLMNTGRIQSNEKLVTESGMKTYTTTTVHSAPVVEKVLLPTQIIEKPVAIHEEIRKEVIEEIQPVINVEKVKTEIHQVTQPLFDKHVENVQISQRTLNTEVLSEVFVEGRGVRTAEDFSTTKFLNTEKVVIEKPAVYNEIERKQIIEEIQPVVYKETIIPTVIQETKPIYQKVVEGAVYVQETLASKGIRSEEEMRLEAERNAYKPSMVAMANTKERVMLPTQVIEKPVAVHESVRKELIEEIQPIMNVEKIKTEVHQITAPLFDKEVKSVNIEKRLLNTEVLSEVHTEGRGLRAAEDFSTTTMLPTKSVVVEKPAMYVEVEKKQIIEEVQPVLYKETIVPTVIQETKPMYQKVVEGPVYTHETLASKGVRSEEEMRLEAERNAYRPSAQVILPTKERMMLPTQIVEKSVAVHEEIRNEVVEEIQPIVNIEKIQTEVHQVTQPLFDKEVRSVLIEKKVLAGEVLPEVLVEGRGVRAVADISSVNYLDTHTVVVEKPSVYVEVEKTQVIEEIQPVIYKETIVPTVIQETKPMYQKVVEGAVYVHETLPMQSVAEWRAHHPSFTTTTTTTTMMSTTPMAVPMMSTPVSTVIMTETQPQLVMNSSRVVTQEPMYSHGSHSSFGSHDSMHSHGSNDLMHGSGSHKMHSDDLKHSSGSHSSFGSHDSKHSHGSHSSFDRKH